MYNLPCHCNKLNKLKTTHSMCVCVIVIDNLNFQFTENLILIMYIKHVYIMSINNKTLDNVNNGNRDILCLIYEETKSHLCY